MKTRTSISLAVAVSAVLATPGRGAVLSSKRGFADVGANYGNLQATGAGWYYTWGTGIGNPGNFDATHYPMFWSVPSQGTIDNVKARNPEYVLGFNEPERSDQANLSVSAAISAWTNISNSFAGTSTKLVSPAVSDTGGASGGQAWLANFMSQAAANNLKVDAVAFHWYGVSTPSNPSGAASSFLSRVDSYHNSYGKPVFITEFAIHDWGGAYTDAEITEANRQFLNIVIPALESRSYVAGYAWYHWFSDARLYESNPPTPTNMGQRYVGAVMTGATEDIGGQDLGEHVAYLAGGTLTQTGTPAKMKYINALANTSTVTGSINWGLDSSSVSNWVRVQNGATLRKSGTNTITLGGGTITNNGIIEIPEGVVRLGAITANGNGVIVLPSTGGATGSTARLELTGNVSLANPITFAQRNDPAGSDGIRNVGGNNTLSGPMTITVGGNQARVRSDSGLLTLGPISTDAGSARNLYLQGTGNGIVNGPISDNAANAAGKINLWKEGIGTWTLAAANTYTGATTINGGVLRLGQQSASPIANYSFDNVSGSTVLNNGTGGSAMNGTLANGAAIVPGGRFGNAVSVANGASVNINNPIVNLGNTANWTVSAWVNTTTAGASILTKGNGGWSSGNTVFYLGDGSAGGSGGIPSAVRWGGGFLQGDSSAAAVNDGAWHQVTYVNSNGAYAIYVDGVAQPLSAGNSGFSNADVGSIVRLGATTNTVAGDGTVHFNGLLDSVQFYGQALSAAQISALYQGQSGAITGLLPAATDVTIASGATLDLNGTTQQIASLSGAAASALTLGAGQLIVNSESSTQFAGTISGNGGSLTKSGNGTLTLAGANTYTGPTTVNNGTLRLASNLTTSPTVTVAGGTLQLAPGGGQSIVLKTPNLAITGAGKVDLTENKLIVTTPNATGTWDGSAYTGVAGLVDAGRGTAGNAMWDGSGIVTSDTRAINNGDLVSVGVAKVGDVRSVADTETTSFAGQTVLGSDTIAMATWGGDANLDGKINIDDYGRIDGNVASSGNVFGWDKGDFNYDGKINIDDYGIIDGNINRQNEPFDTAGRATSATLQGAAAIPEPAGLSLIALSAASLARRRRR